jgi:hypothetical protein
MRAVSSRAFAFSRPASEIDMSRVLRRSCAVALLGAVLALGATAEPDENEDCRARAQEVGEIRVGVRPPEPVLARLTDLTASTNEERRAALAELFEQVGCPELSDAPFSKRAPANLVCRLPGRLGRRILVGAHFDKTGRGAGIVDNWSGAAMLANLVESLSAVERRHEFVFVGFSEEEKGLIGSRAYVRGMSPADREALVAMVNIDTIGMGPLRVETRFSDSKLVCDYLIAQALAEQPAQAVSFGFGISSDFEPFRKAGFPTLSFSSHRKEWEKILHQRRDQLAEIDRDAYYASYRGIAFTLAVLDAALSRDVAGSD